MATFHSTMLLRRTARRTSVLLAALALVGAPGRAAAQQVVNACYVPSVGAVYLIGLPGSPPACLAPGHIPVTLRDSALADGSVITIKLANGAVTIAKLSFDPATQAELDALAVPDTINNSTNPVDWTKLKGVPAGFADGRDSVGGAGVTDHGGLGGLTDDDHPQYVPVSGERTGSTGFAVSGILTGSGAPPASGGGVRIMFWPAQAAFRVGGVGGTQWDASSVGQLSMAMGENTTASGTNSTAIGNGTTASGEGSTAIGSLTAASGLYSTAMGRNTTAGGEASTAMGDGASASGRASTAMGDATASGNYSTAMGEFTTASGEASTAMGNNTTASGTYSTAMGHSASTNGQAGSLVYGDNSTASGLVSATAPNQFVVRAAGGFQLRTSANLSTGCDLPAGSGSWSCASSRALKTDFELLDGEEVLSRVRELPVLKWSYETEPSVRHIGTFAEDFHSAFGLGTSSTSIGLIDMDGVNLAAVQALERRTRQLREALTEKDREIAALWERLARLEAALGPR